ncbi:pimeloyl-ACP methyl ester carboxylesterase [Salirhabdus euzebyi]|uniref:Pimeloyl-ACP methyl ester carboxylesterase n=1 Tax=Salirhabdus euzebyi TaxID=394506 RepID=A0A841Q7A5_9BACI|nr:alpha/beta hydrolase [Salirhabdus euzebyi]MBB6454172.1 pimeloyl-ACP methyl ester carboxylesterase [Salirhabdus euzebyi]
MSKILLKKVDLPNGETLGYREREGGEKIILLIHGNMTSSKHWDVVLENMDPKYKLYAVDLRGFGVSTYKNIIKEVRDLSEDVRLFVDQLNIQPYAIVGWSMGGEVSLQYCADHVDACEKLLLINSGSTRGYPVYPLGKDGLPVVTQRLETYEEIRADKTKTQIVQGAYDAKNKDLLKAIWDLTIYRKRKPDAEKYDEYLEDMLTQRNLAETYHMQNIFNIGSAHNGLVEGTNQAKNINIPVLVMHGNEDIIVNEKMTNEILEDIGPNAEYKKLTGCGHSPLIDDLDMLLNTMESFLDRKE